MRMYTPNMAWNPLTPILIARYRRRTGTLYFSPLNHLKGFCLIRILDASITNNICKIRPGSHLRWRQSGATITDSVKKS